MGEDEDFELDEFEFEPPEWRWRWACVPMGFWLGFVRMIMHLNDNLQAAYNHRISQEQFAAQAARELEMITEES